VPVGPWGNTQYWCPSNEEVSYLCLELGVESVGAAAQQLPHGRPPLHPVLGRVVAVLALARVGADVLPREALAVPDDGNDGGKVAKRTTLRWRVCVALPRHRASSQRVAMPATYVAVMCLNCVPTPGQDQPNGCRAESDNKQLLVAVAR